MNGGAQSSILCFDSSDRTTGLKPIPGTLIDLALNETTPPSGPGGSASHLIFSADEQTLYGAVKGNPATGLKGFVVAWDVAADGSLGPGIKVEEPNVGAEPFALANIPDHPDALFLVDAAVGVEILDLSGGIARAAAANGSATQFLPVPGNRAVCWVARSPKTGSYYITDFFTNLITEIALDGTVASLVDQYYTEQYAAITDLEITSFGGKEYVVFQCSVERTS